MLRVASAIGALVLLLLTGLAATQWVMAAGRAKPVVVMAKPVAATPAAKKAGPPPVPQPPPVAQVLQTGVLIVISKASQQMFVFKDGAFWKSSPVSTGKRGHATPAGVFPILQKRVRHRSNIYSNAPMPYMQRLTWSGIAIHAGYLPGYPASHGCIRLPKAFARALYDLTRIGSTTVIVTNSAVSSDAEARTLALATDPPQGSAQPAVPPVPKPSPYIETLPLDVPLNQPAGRGQTIQLAAAASADEAQAHWARLVVVHPELRQFQMTVVPALVRSRRVYRLRATAPGAHNWCAARKRSGGEACFNVN